MYCLGMRFTLYLVVAMLAACAPSGDSGGGNACPPCPTCDVRDSVAALDAHSPRFLWKVYVREERGLGLPAGSRFFVAELGSVEVCEEIAGMYNAKPSLVAAGVLRFQCDLSGPQR